ncbi:hypothetical protein ACWDWU_12490, partial [Streptomyces sp. NPDC003442]
KAAQHLSRGEPGLAAWFRRWARLERVALSLYAHAGTRRPRPARGAREPQAPEREPEPEAETEAAGDGPGAKPEAEPAPEPAPGAPGTPATSEDVTPDASPDHDTDDQPGGAA